MSSSSIRHAPLGANASFDFGPPGAPAGFAVPATVPHPQPFFVGCRNGPAQPWLLLPFFTAGDQGPRPLAPGRYGRFFALAGDKWMIGPLVFKVCTPYFLQPSDDDLLDYAPVVCAYLEYDNTHSDDSADLVFGVGSREAEPLNKEDLAGFRFGDSHGYATAASDEVKVFRNTGEFGTPLAPANILQFQVPPHSKRVYPLVLGFYRAGDYASELFANLVAVLKFGLLEHPRYIAATDALDAEFMRSNRSVEEKAQLARDVRAWLAETHRLAGQPSVDLAPLRRIHDLATGKA